MCCCIHFVELNGKSIGLAVVKDESCTAQRKVLSGVLNNMGFDNSEDYLGSLPGYSNRETIIYSTEREFINFKVQRKQRKNTFYFKLEAYREKVDPLSICLILETFCGVNRGDNMFIVRPTVAQCNKVYDEQGTPITSNNSKLWFCEDWNEDA